MRNNRANTITSSTWYSLMEGDHIILIFGITFASLAIGAYVLFGPNFGSRKKTPVLGLQNLGQTCFMNTILQALGSCPIFIRWLDSQNQSLGEVGHALRNILLRLGQVACKESREYSIQPLEFMSVLSQHGWQMSLYNNVQQDAHELLTFILSKIEDEIFLNIKNQRNGLGWLDKESGLDDPPSLPPLSDASSVSLNASPSGDSRREILLRARKRTLSLHNTNMQTHCASPFRGRLVSQIRCAVCGHENPLKYDNFDSLSLHLPLKASLGQTHTLQGLLEDFVNTEIINEFECDVCNKNTAPTLISGDGVSNPLDISPSITSGAGRVSNIPNGEGLHPVEFGTECDELSGGSPGVLGTSDGVFGSAGERSSVDSDMATGDGTLHGDLVNGHSSTNTPRHSSTPPGGDPNSLPGSVETDGTQTVLPRRKILSDAVRTLRIGKLPPCLCFHVHRTCYSNAGGAYKRADYVDFPEYLAMEPYTYNAALREREMKRQLVMRLNGAFPTSREANGVDCRWGRASNVYRLKSVVVHRGSAEDGHFVTYRRGPLHSLARHRSLAPPPLANSSLETGFESRWYFTSDADIRESSLAQALKSAAYMLFYERCSPALLTNDPQPNGLSTENQQDGDSVPAPRLTNGHCVT